MKKQTQRQRELAHMRAVDSFSDHARINRESDKLRDMETPMVLGYELNRQTLTPLKHPLPVRVPGKDYGADPLGRDEDGVFRWRMVPSGDIVGAEERTRRLESSR